MSDLGTEMRVVGLRKENARAWAEVERLRYELDRVDKMLHMSGILWQDRITQARRITSAELAVGQSQTEPK